MASSSSLPAEIWIQIATQLCLHCHMPKNSNGIPDVGLAEAREGKAALKALCLVSREFRAISQPILFHYFLNFPDGGELCFEANERHDQVPSFLRSLVLNPSLGLHVRMIGLFDVQLQTFHDIKRRDLDEWSFVSTRYQVKVPIEVTRALAGDETQGERGWLLFDGPGPSAQLMRGDVRAVSVTNAVYKWLNVLTLNLVPHITHLQLTRPLGSLKDIQVSPPIFSNLRELTYDEHRSIEEVVESQILFPNLSTLGVRNWDGLDLGEIKNPVPAMNLRKLLINCTPGVLMTFLQLCINLEDLECQLEPNYEGTVVQWPEHTRSTLRRLAWSKEWEQSDLDRDWVVPLGEFKVLEILEIHQSSLLVHSKLGGAENLSSVLPKTLRMLRIAFTRSVMSRVEISRQLRKVASVKDDELPRLSIVQVDEPPRWGSKKKTLADYMARTGVIEIMKHVGVDLRIGYEAPA